MKHRLERVNEIIKRELSEIVRREFIFSAPLVTVQSADVAPDLKNCRVFISIIGTPAQEKDALGKLNDKKGFLQRALGKRVVLKYTPHLHFLLDTSVERGNRIMQIMDEIVIPPDDERCQSKTANETDGQE